MISLDYASLSAITETKIKAAKKVPSSLKMNKLQ